MRRAAVRPTEISRFRPRGAIRSRRRGAATLDYVLLLGLLMTISGFMVRYGTQIIQLTYEMINVLVASPFM